MNSIAELIKKGAREIINEAVKIRRHIHMYPELSFREYNTSKYICEFLDKNSIDYIDKVGGTGIIAWIEGQQGNGKTIALRSELDALPIEEKSGLEFESRNRGVMHACGHDAHTAMLMASAKLLNALRPHIQGRIVFIFQPGEELAPGGASLLMKEEAFRKMNINLIIAQHILPDFETGLLGFRGGIYMASSDEIHINIKGLGGHAALPGHSTDQVLAGSTLVTRLKEKAPGLIKDKEAVLAIGRFIADGATNIIPSVVNIQGTIRTFDENLRTQLKKMVSDECDSIRKEFGVETDTDLPDGYPVLINSEEYTMKSVELAGMINGKENIRLLDKRMSSEDFAFYSREFPTVFYRLGIRSDKEGMHGLHTPSFTIDEKAMITGIRTICYLAVRFAEGY